MTPANASGTGRIAERLRGRRLLVTGATGLLAKVFVEKLLRSVPQVGAIRLLVRDRPDGTSGSTRLQSEILGSSAFDRLRALLGDGFATLAAEKIQVVNGDLTAPQLGLDDARYAELAANCDLIVNSAAAVTFDERLDLALQLNALGPSQLLQLSRDAGHIPVMQVSTCYVSGQRSGAIAETLSPPPDGRSIDLDRVIDRMSQACRQVKAQSELGSEDQRRQLIDLGMAIAREHGWNDTYTFTKWIGEQLVERQRGPIPTVILRPAIIESSYREPMPGWIDGLRMADPMIIAFGRGKLGEFPADPEVPIDLIPVDLVANAMIATLPEAAAGPGLRIYQVASSQRHPLRVSELARHLSAAFRRWPMVDDAGAVIRPGEFRLVQRKAFFAKWQGKLNHATRYRRLLERLHLAPMYRRRLATLIAQIEQIIYFARIYSPYTHLDCRFCVDQLHAVTEALHPDDRREFPVDTRDIDWSEYITGRHVPGLRRYVLGGYQSVAGHLPPPIHRPRHELTLRRIRQEHTTIFGVFQAVAELCADKPALQICRGGRWIRYTYGEALDASAAVARRLQEHNLQPGDRLVLCADNAPEWGLVYLAAMRCGLTVVPLDPQQPAAELLDCARIAGARLICADRRIAESLSAAAQDGATPPWSGPMRVIDESLVPPPGAARDPGPPAAATPADALASILFTSGTTVAPKAVPLTHGNLLANARAMLKIHRLRSNERFCSVLPLYHAFEFTCGFLVPLCIGATITYVEELKAPRVLDALQASRATIMLAVPRLLKLFHDGIQSQVAQSGAVTRAAFKGCGRLSDLSGHRLGPLLYRAVHRRFGGHFRKFISGGSALDPELYHAFTRMGFEVYEGYGLTETAPVLTVNPAGRSRPGSIGVALPGVNLDIRNANAEGIGELWAQGPNVMQGYLDNPEATAEVLRQGWFRTGDLVRRDRDGYYTITGRVKDMIVTEAGKNVYPDEVEVRYKDLPYVKELCVLGMPSAGGMGESVHAVVIPDYETAPALDRSAVERGIREAAAGIAASIPAHQRIQSMHFWKTELPKTSTLKAKRGVIRDMLLGGTTTSTGRSTHRTAERPAGALTDQQRFVRRVLAQLTRESEHAIHPDTHLLLDLGLDSLMKLQLIGELEAHFGVTCTNEQASALARVGDLDKLVGDRPQIRGKSAATAPWKERPAAGTTAPLAANGAMGLPLHSARWATRTGLAVMLNSYIRVRGRQVRNIPAHGPFLLVANHSSHLDAVSVLTAIANRRRVWVAGAEDYFFNTRAKSWIFGRLLDTIPFDRFSEGYEGLRRCLERLGQGDGLLFFPEGTRSVDGRMAEFKIGAALMAVESGAVVIPTYIGNAFALLPKGRRLAKPGVIRVTFGNPIDPAAWQCPDDLNRQYQRYREMTAHIQDRVRELAGPAESRP